VLKEFKDFIMKGNLLEVAVGLILALAFKSVIDSLVNIFNQLITALVGSDTPFGALTFRVRETDVAYGPFLDALFSFVVIGFILFLIVKAYTRMVELARKKGETEETPEDAADVILLREIRDLLQAKG
jgi:large conductance mechanosensitive channel